MQRSELEHIIRKALETEGALEQALSSGRPTVIDVKTHIEGIAPLAWVPE